MYSHRGRSGRPSTRRRGSGSCSDDDTYLSDKDRESNYSSSKNRGRSDRNSSSQGDRPRGRHTSQYNHRSSMGRFFLDRGGSNFRGRSSFSDRRPAGGERRGDMGPREFYINRFVIFSHIADSDVKLNVAPYKGSHNEVYDGQDKVYLHQPEFDGKLNYPGLYYPFSYCMRRAVEKYNGDRHGELFIIARYGRIFFTEVESKSNWTAGSFMNSVNVYQWPFNEELPNKMQPVFAEAKHSFYPINDTVNRSNIEHRLIKKNFQKSDSCEEYYVSYALPKEEGKRSRNVFICYDDRLDFLRFRVPNIKWCDIDISRPDNIDLRISLRSEKVITKRDLNGRNRLAEMLIDIPYKSLLTRDKKGNVKVLRNRNHVQMIRNKKTDSYIITREFCESNDLDPFWQYLTINCTEVTEYSRLDKEIGAFKTVESKCEVTAVVDHISKLKMHKDDERRRDVVKTMLKFFAHQLPKMF